MKDVETILKRGDLLERRGANLRTAERMPNAEPIVHLAMLLRPFRGTAPAFAAPAPQSGSGVHQEPT